VVVPVARSFAARTRVAGVPDDWGQVVAELLGEVQAGRRRAAMAEAEHRAVGRLERVAAAAAAAGGQRGPYPLEEVRGGDGVLVLASAGPHGHVAHGAAGGPVPLAVLAEVARLVDVVVVEVAELGVHAVAARARQHLVGLLQLLPLAGSVAGLLMRLR